VTIIGGRERQINVWVDPAKLQKLRPLGGDVERALRTQNLELPSGRVEQGSRQLTLRTLGRVKSPSTAARHRRLVPRQLPIQLSDIAPSRTAPPSR
jgi:multidrug efflux pump subunit AcrB